MQIANNYETFISSDKMSLSFEQTKQDSSNFVKDWNLFYFSKLMNI